MHDAKPVLTVLLLSGVGLLLLCLEWFSAAPHVREERLFAIAQLEAARTLPPRTLEVQAQWLLTHRLARLQSLGLLVGVSALVGLGEGLAWRQRDVLAGMRLRNWTLGVVGGAWLPGLLVVVLLLPWPWSLGVVGSGGALWSALTMFLLTSGRPSLV